MTGWNDYGQQETRPSLWDAPVTLMDYKRQEIQPREENTMLTAIEAAKMRNATPYTLTEIESDIRRLANITSRVYGYDPKKMPEELIQTLVAHGYEVSKDDDGRLSISWYQATANELIEARSELEEAPCPTNS